MGGNGDYNNFNYNTKFQDITDIGFLSKYVIPLIYSLNPESLRNTLAFELFF